MEKGEGKDKNIKKKNNSNNKAPKINEMNDSSYINTDKCIELLLRLYCFKKELEGKMKNFDKIDDKDKMEVNCFFIDKNTCDKFKELFEYEEFKTSIKKKLDFIKDGNGIIRSDNLDEKENVLTIIDAFKKSNKNLFNKIKEKKIKKEDIKDNYPNLNRYNENKIKIDFFEEFELINISIYNLFLEIFSFKNCMGFCNYILGKQYIFALFIGISKEYPIIAEVGKFKDNNFKVKYIFKIPNKGFQTNKFLNYIKGIELYNFFNKNDKENQYIKINGISLYYYNVDESKTLKLSNMLDSIKRIINIFEKNEYFKKYKSLYKMISVYCNYSLMGKKVGNDEFIFKKCCLINHDFLQEIKINLNYKQLKDDLESDKNIEKIIGTNFNLINIDKIIESLPETIKEKYKQLDENSFPKTKNIQPDTIPKQIGNETIFILDKFEIIDNTGFQLFCDNIQFKIDEKEQEAKYLYINEKIIVNLPNYLNEKKYITIIGDMDYDSKEIIITHILVYKEKKYQKKHLGIISTNILNYLNNINQEISIITLEGKEIGKILKNKIEEEQIIPEPQPQPIQTKIGLQNIGATCYMNATLQCFAHIKSFVEFFKTDKNHITTLSDKKTLSYSFKLLLDNLWPEPENLNKNKKNYYEPTEFKEKISKMNPLFAGVAANDSKDLINFLIMTLHDELNDASNIIMNSNFILDQRNKDLIYQEFIKDFKQKYNSIISRIFYGINCNITQCTECGTQLFNYQVFFFIIFPLEEVRKYVFSFNNPMNFNRNPNIVDIFECFEFDRRFNLMSGENAMFCNICQRSTNSNIGTHLVTGPEVLILILNRGKGKEFDVKLNFYEQLNLFNYIEKKEYGFNYQLIGVITHLGESGMGGHFIAFCRDPNNSSWFKFNDAIVTPVENFQKDVIYFGMPYLLFYQKIYNY